MHRILSLVLLCTASVNAWAQTPLSASVEAGDVVFQASRSSQSVAVSAATGSPYTHMGVIEWVKGKPMVVEAVGPVKRTPLQRWVRRGVDGHVVVKRLRARERLLTPSNLARMGRVAKRFMGTPYDGLFQWGHKALYCSELVYLVYLGGAGISLGEIQRVGDLNLAPESVRRLIKKRLGARLDHSEPIITPASIFADPRLTTVYSNTPPSTAIAPVR